MKQKLTYFRRTRTFVLSLLLLSCMAAQGQQQPSRMVKGLVKDARTGEPLAGVAVLVRGTTQGTTTGISGEYAVSVPSGSTELEFSFLGYVAKIQKIGTAHTLDVTMEEEATGLQEVVVVGYGVQKKANLTGSRFCFPACRRLSFVYRPCGKRGCPYGHPRCMCCVSSFFCFSAIMFCGNKISANGLSWLLCDFAKCRLDGCDIFG